MEIPDRITIEPGKMGGQPCIRGHRFTVEHLLSLVGAGWTLEQIQEDSPFTEAADIQQAIAFAAFPVRGISFADDAIDVGSVAFL